MINFKPLLSTEGKRPGFFYGYIILLISFLILMIYGGTLYTFGVFLKPLSTEFGLTRAVTTGASSLNLVLSGVFSIFAGRLNDRFGPRLIVTIGGFFTGIGYLLMSTIGNIRDLYLCYGILMSIGVANIVVPLQSTSTRWFIKRRGLANGLAMSGVGVGIIVFPAIANLLITSTSWRISYAIIGLITLVLIIIPAQLLRRDPGEKRVLLHGAANTLHNGIANPQTSGFSLWEAMHTRQCWMLSIVCFLFAFCLHTVMVHLVPHVTDIQMPVGAAAFVLSIVGMLSVGGKIGMGSISDRIGNKQVMIIVFILTSLSFVWLILANELWMLYLFAVVFGVAYGGFVAIHSPIVADFFETKAHGAIFGLTLFVTNIGGATGSFLAGHLFDVSGSYYWAFVICIMLNIVGLIILILLKAGRATHKFKEKVETYH